MEENKVARERLYQLILSHAPMSDSNCKELTDRLIQSPDLRITLVEPRFYASGRYVYERTQRLHPHRTIAEFWYEDAELQASLAAATLNSKEPK